jgi:DNA-binding NarL/FixJ family response regulator
MLGKRGPEGPLAALTPRERDVLAAMAEGKSNHGIAEALFVSAAAVEKHVTNIFQKLGLGPTPSEHRRVHAVLTYLRSSAS